MPIAAVPEYLGKLDLSKASPSLRFGMFLSVWTDRRDQESEVRDRAGKKSREGMEIDALLKGQGMDAVVQELCRRERNPLPGLWKKSDFFSRKAWQELSRMTRADQERIDALNARQRSIASLLQSAGDLFILDGRSVSPFTTGLGNEHPLENGFAFLEPYGIPYLPGSGVKGVVRQAARELASGEWGETKGWTKDLIEVLFGHEDSKDARQGALRFWDVIPRIGGKGLMVEVMTAHQSHYYQNGEAPHDSGSPNPIKFLTVPPGAEFTFHVVCNDKLLVGHPELRRDGAWQGLLQSAFAHAFEWVGFGAKTAVGYGAMEIDRAKAEAAARRRAEEEERQQQEEEEKRKQAEYEALPESEKRIISFEKSLDELPQMSPLKKDSFGLLIGEVNRLSDDAKDWAPDERKRVADVLEAAFERFGWAPSGLRADKRRKQEKKRRALIDELRQ